MRRRLALGPRRGLAVGVGGLRLAAAPLLLAQRRRRRRLRPVLAGRERVLDPLLAVGDAPVGTTTALRAAESLDAALVIALPTAGGVLLIAVVVSAAVIVCRRRRRVRSPTRYPSTRTEGVGKPGIKVDRI